MELPEESMLSPRNTSSCGADLKPITEMCTFCIAVETSCVRRFKKRIHYLQQESTRSEKRKLSGAVRTVNIGTVEPSLLRDSSPNTVLVSNLVVYFVP